MLKELCIGELKDDREAHARREARKLERRSLLLMQSPVMDKLYAERWRQQQLQHNRSISTWLRRGAIAVSVVVIAVVLAMMTSA